MSLGGHSLGRVALAGGRLQVRYITTAPTLDSVQASISIAASIGIELNATLASVSASIGAAHGVAVTTAASLDGVQASFDVGVPYAATIDATLDDVAVSFDVRHAPKIDIGISTTLDDVQPSFEVTRYAPALSGTSAATVQARTYLIGGSASFGITASASSPTGTAWIGLQLRAIARGVVSAGVTCRAGATLSKGAVSASVSLSTLRTGVATTTGGMGGLRLSVRSPVHSGTGPGGTGGSHHSWSVRVGSEPLTGTLTVSGSENGARIASFTVQGLSGLSPGEPVTIDLSSGDYASRIYQGVVQTVAYRPDDDLSEIDCSDELQQKADSLSNAQIDELTPDAISPPGSSLTGYSYLTARLKTVAASVYLPLGGKLTVMPWTTTAGEYGPTISRTLWGSPELRRARVDEPDPADPTANQIRRKEYHITVNLSWVRIAQADGGRYQWSSGVDACEWLNRVPLPSYDAVESAINGTGWEAHDVSIRRADWVSGLYRCTPGGKPYGVHISPGDSGMPAVFAQWKLKKRYLRTMRGEIRLRVIDSEASPDDPVDIVERSVTIKDVRDGSRWVDAGLVGDSYYDPEGDWHADLLDIGDDDETKIGLDDLREQEVSIKSNLEYEVATAAVEVAQSRRVETMSADTLINPDVELGSKATISHPSVSRTGRVISVSHTLDIDSGSGTTRFEIGMYTPTDAETQVSDGAVSAVDEYDSDEVHVPGASGSGGTWIGGVKLKTTGIQTRLPWSPEDIPLQPRTVIAGVTSGTLPANMDRFQGFVGNKPPTVTWYPGYDADILGFYVSAPPIILPEYTGDPDATARKLIVL